MCAMIAQPFRNDALSRWDGTLRNKAALLERPGFHHKALITQAYALHQEQFIDRDDLSDLLELADAALAFAVESLLDINRDE